jgi:hypothetical protein
MPKRKCQTSFLVSCDRDNSIFTNSCDRFGEGDRG